RYCYRTGLAVDFTTPNRLATLPRKKAVFLPATTVMSDAEVAAFRAFVENGGILFADSEPGLLDEWMNRRESPPLKGLWCKFDPAVRDDEMAKLLSDAGVFVRERISGLPPEETVFRVREGGGMRLVGFKTESRCLGTDVDISLGSSGFVYAVDSGFVGRADKVSLRKISVPFGLYAVFGSEQQPPSFAMPAQARQGEKVSWSTGALRRGGVYRFSVRTPSGAELGHREEVFTADGRPRSFTFALDDEAGPWRFTLRDIATGEEAVADTVCTAGDGGLVALARDGRALAAIVVAKDANKAARFAAADLKWHLDQITGGDFKIVEDDTPRTGFEILVGPSSRTKAKKGDYAFQEWGVNISSESIELVGLDREDKGRPTFSITERDGVTGSNWPWMYDEQGTMYAVYDFLERECGVVWANPSDYGTGIRKDPNLAVAPASRRGRPWMSYRGGAPLDREVVTPLDWKRGSEGERRYNEFAYAHPKAKGLQDKLYMLRNRLGGDFAKANHSFYWWYDRFWNEKSKTFEAFRPEYFAKGYDGQPPQLCYMNPEVVAKTVEDVRRYFDDAEFRRRHFNDTGRDHFIWGENNYCLEPMDNSSFCKCRDCSRLYEPERRGDNSMHSTYWFTFVNAVAREIGRSHPSKRITTLAYMSHEGLPRGVALEDNVTVYFCISANRMPNSANHPKQFARMAEWRRAYPRQPLAMWLYNCFPMEVARNGNWHCFPGFFAHEAERQYRFFMEQDIRGGVLHCGFVDNVDNYLQCKWMVDPSRRADDLLDEYFSIFGRAARPLRAFYDLVERRFCDKSLYPGNSTHQTVKIAWGALGDGPTMERLAGYMDEAERLAETDLEKARVKEWR
ncbi:MAG: DUF4838 domain-containing protein, partial [Kiritimatiellae bacterium]|nr:DUF4838 domain-containing protein [Kiritimatiellia bacterium]